jgi:hypothetical protein
MRSVMGCFGETDEAETLPSRDSTDRGLSGYD